ncbi:MAG TPA: class I SAM-dependent methyltransferase [Actinoplanes sp.]|nr:class I SAM-dependent methyltransferase [Actinoplanes sp.]
MDAHLRSWLDRLHADGQARDAAEPDRRRRLRNLEPDTAALLNLVLRISRGRAVVEIGTSNGYSVIWLAEAVRDTGGAVVTVDTERSADAAANVAQAGLSALVTFETGDGGDFLARQPPDSVDLLFLDAERVEYPRWWPHPKRVLRPGGVLAVDNVLSHPGEVAEFLALAHADPDLVGATIGVGKGLYLAQRRP